MSQPRPCNPSIPDCSNLSATSTFISYVLTDHLLTSVQTTSTSVALSGSHQRPSTAHRPLLDEAKTLPRLCPHQPNAGARSCRAVHQRNRSACRCERL